MATVSDPPPTTTGAARTDPASHRLRGTLGPASIVLMVVAAAAPLTVVAGSFPIGIAAGNGPGYPAMYVVAGVVLAFFAVGFTAMTRHVPNAGAFYSYIGTGLGRGAGLGSALVALISYLTVQGAVYGYVGFLLDDLVTGYGGPDLPWWLWTAAVLAVTGLLGYRHIELSSKVLGVLLVAEVGIVLVLDVAVIGRGGGDEGLSSALVTPADVLSGAPGIGLMFAIAGFIGFEATAIFRDEARDPERTIPIATYAALAIITVFYTVSAWAIVSAWGDSRIVEESAADPGGIVVATAQEYVGPIAADIMQVLFVTSLFAAILAFHNVTSRYFFSLGNTGVLPAICGRSHTRHASPHVASLVTSGVGALLMAVCVIAGLDPVLEIFTWLAGIASVGIVVLMLMACLAVLVFFRRTGVDRRPWQTLVAPSLGLLGLAAILVLLVKNLPLLMGGSTVLGVGAGVLLAVALAAGWALAKARPQAARALTTASPADDAPLI
ncbi:APC family permease [Geodermatophilus sabuli]|uniref:Amino acid/polyamine/organocation transporter, APC superfamily n=1 Tax=Geodermatophilus sabuli TaxID=1564158 RepID=A0A285EA47_9ACTN|nr:APC family permease [Geodermatophilus sabuli]MBB3082196.1 amino acid transporter [Geodermatophilus sabuli]SNX94931.1 amino acid/polyamine/organocation transporter, APC superfamily [Geodermatophilus sabuli]